MYGRARARDRRMGGAKNAATRERMQGDLEHPVEALRRRRSVLFSDATDGGRMDRSDARIYYPHHLGLSLLGLSKRERRPHGRRAKTNRRKYHLSIYYLNNRQISEAMMLSGLFVFTATTTRMYVVIRTRLLLRTILYLCLFLFELLCLNTPHPL